MTSNADAEDADIAAAIIAAAAAPTDWRPHFRLGSAYLSHDMFLEAIAPLKRARDLDRTRVAILLDLSTALTNSGDARGGEASARDAIALDPLSAGYFYLGNALRKQGKPEAAVDMFRKHLELDPLDTIARCNLGLALGHAGRHQEALAEFEAVLLSRPDDFKALAGAGTALRVLRDLDRAISMLRRASEVDPLDTETWGALGWCLLKTRRYPEALEAFDRLLALDPHDVKGNFNKTATLINLGRLSDAIEHAERALELGPEQSQVAELIEVARKSLSAQQVMDSSPGDS